MIKQLEKCKTIHTHLKQETMVNSNVIKTKFDINTNFYVYFYMTG